MKTLIMNDGCENKGSFILTKESSTDSSICTCTKETFGQMPAGSDDDEGRAICHRLYPDTPRINFVFSVLSPMLILRVQWG